MNAQREIIKMRDGIPDDIFWVCDNCGNDFDKEEAANVCCENQILLAGKFVSVCDYPFAY